MDYLGLLNFSVNGGYYGGYYVTDVKGHPLGARLLGINMTCQSKEISQPEVMSSIQVLVWLTWWSHIILLQCLNDVGLVIQ